MKMWSKYLAANLTIIWSKPLKFRVFFPRFFFYYSFNCVKRIRFCVCFYLWVYQFISRANSISPVLLLEHEIKPTLWRERKKLYQRMKPYGKFADNGTLCKHIIWILEKLQQKKADALLLYCVCIPAYREDLDVDYNGRSNDGIR